MNDNRTVKHKTKDSVFTKLFEDMNNILSLYKELHPEDTAVTIDDIQLETLETVLVNDIYNDLGFIVNDGRTARYILLVEAQSKWIENMTLRMLFYLSETYRRYLKKTKQSEHIAKRVHLPKPELYVVYTGNKDLPDEISFKDDYFDGDAPIDIRVKILKQPGQNTIYGQYIGFCKVYDKQRKIYSNKLECIKETLKICFENGYLTEFLNHYQQEVVTMMSELFDEEALREQYDIALAEQVRAEGKAEGRAEGKAEERNTNIKNSIAALKPVLNSFEAVAKVIMQSFNLTESEATEKVTAYWNLI